MINLVHTIKIIYILKWFNMKNICYQVNVNNLKCLCKWTCIMIFLKVWIVTLNQWKSFQIYYKIKMKIVFKIQKQNLSLRHLKMFLITITNKNPKRVSKINWNLLSLRIFLFLKLSNKWKNIKIAINLNLCKNLSLRLNKYMHWMIMM